MSCPPFCTSSSGYGHKSATHLLDAEEVPAQGFGMSELIEPQQLLERIGLISETALAAMIGVGIKEEFVREFLGVTGPAPPPRPTVTRKQRKSLSGQRLRCLDPAMWVLVLLALIVASPATAETDNDTVVRSAKPRFQIVDGDTVKFGPQLVRLFGIDAPEKGQTCDDGQWHPGPLAKKALEDFIAGRPVTCKQVDYDARDNRPVAQCFAGEDDLQAMMVSAGWAWSFGRYSDRYAPEEREAMGQKAGVHAHRCVPPWEWRAQQRAAGRR